MANPVFFQRLVTKDNLPPGAEAASLALAIVAAAKVATWEDLEQCDTPPPALGKLVVSPRQARVLAEHADIVRQVSNASPRRSVSVCSECGQWMVTVGPTRGPCKTTPGCTGTLVYAVAAVREKTHD